MNTRSVLVVEDDTLLRELIASALEARGYQVQSAANVSDAKRAFISGDPDGVVLDIELGPGPNGFDLAHIIRSSSPETGIVFLTHLPDSRFAAVDPDGLPSGVAYLRKSGLSDLNVLFDALESAIAGQVPAHYRHDRDTERPFGHLTRKQIEVLRLMTQGQSNAQIAATRGTTVKSVEDAIRRACEAIGVDSKVEGNSRTAAVTRYLSITGTHSAAQS